MSKSKELVKRLREYAEYRTTAQQLSSDLWAAADLIERLTTERDSWQNVVGQIASSVPIPLVLEKTGSVKDLIEYFISLSDRVGKAEAELRALTKQ